MVDGGLNVIEHGSGRRWVNWLFIHQNFPGQYVHLASHLAMSGHRVVAIAQRSQPPVDGVRTIRYVPTENAPRPHDYLRPVDSAVRNGLGVARVQRNCERRVLPDLIIGHNGWGELFYVKDVWPDVPLLGYFEFFYRASGSDVDFDPARMADPDVACGCAPRNAINLIGLDAVDWGDTPTQWRLDQVPACRIRPQITVVHERDRQLHRVPESDRAGVAGWRPLVRPAGRDHHLQFPQSGTLSGLRHLHARAAARCARPTERACIDRWWRWRELSSKARERRELASSADGGACPTNWTSGAFTLSAGCRFDGTWRSCKSPRCTST